MLKGLGGLGDMAKMLSKAQELQTKMQELQERLETIEVVGSSGAGMVRATATAKGKLVAMSIDPSLMGSNSDEDRQVLEDLIVAAVTDAQAKASERAQEEMKELTAGLPLPPGFAPPV